MDNSERTAEMDNLNLLIPSEEANAWKMQDWRWDPFKLEAEPERSKPTRNRSQRGPVICQVDGCGADLTGLKEYHQRYKICEYHLKVSSIIKDAVQQRFCQQCGRFHVLSEFDGVKRSCRARLERHNARRRKKSESHNRRSPSTLAPSALQIATTKEESKATDSVESQYDIEMSQYEMEDMLQAPQGMVDTVLPPSSMGMDHQELPCLEGKQDALMQLDQMFYDSTDADQSQSPSMMMGNDAMHLDPREVPSSEEGDPIAEVFRNFSRSPEARDLLNAMQSSVSASVRHDSQSSSSVCPSQVLLSSQTDVLPGRPVFEPISMLGPPMGSQFGNQGMLSMGVSQPQDMQASDAHCGNFVGQLRSGGLGPLALSDARLGDGDRNETQHQDMLDDRGTAALYDSLLKLTSLSVKVFSCTPANLPAPLRRELLGAVRGGLVPEGYMRPGCVQLTFDVRHDAAHEVTCDDVVKHLLSVEDHSFWKDHQFLVQLADSAVIVKDSAVIQHIEQEAMPTVFPVADHVRPICILNKAGESFKLSGHRIAGIQDMVHCRLGGRHLNVECDYDDSHGETVICSLDEDCPSGSIRVTAAHNNILMTDSLPVLALNDEAAVAEVRELEDENLCESSLRSFLLDVGMVVEFGDWLLKRCEVGGLWPQSGTPTRDYTIEEVQTICQVGDQLLAYACQRGWRALTRKLLPVALFSVHLRKSSICVSTSNGSRKDARGVLSAEEVIPWSSCPNKNGVPCEGSTNEVASPNVVCTIDREGGGFADCDHRKVFSVTDKATMPLASRGIIDKKCVQPLQVVKEILGEANSGKHITGSILLDVLLKKHILSMCRNGRDAIAGRAYAFITRMSTISQLFGLLTSFSMFALSS